MHSSLRAVGRALLVCGALSGALLSTAGCTSEMETEEKVEPDVPPTSLDERSCPPASTLSWESFGAPFMLNWCNSCHGGALPAGERADAPAGVNFDTLEDTRDWADRIWARAADHNLTMPPVGGPEQEERARLGDWLACGALERADFEGE